MRLISCRNGRPLAEKISGILESPLLNVEFIDFADSEFKVVLKDSVRRHNVFIIQSFTVNHDRELMEYKQTADVVMRSWGKFTVGILPLMPYARQDRMQMREPITSRLVADELQLRTQGISTIDLHNPATQGNFSIPIDNASAMYLLVDKLKETLPDSEWKNSIIASPDEGGTKRAGKFSKALFEGYKKIAIALKDRDPITNETMHYDMIGNVKNKHVIIVDDLIETGGTLIGAAKMFKERGALDVIACIPHAVMPTGFQKLEDSIIDKIITTDSIPQDFTGSQKIEVVSIAPLLAQIIHGIHTGEPVSHLFI